MKYGLTRYLAAWLPLAALFSCVKSNNPPGTASLTIVNAVAGSNPLYTNFSTTQALEWYFAAAQISFGSSEEFSSFSGHQQLALYQDTLAQSAPLYNLTLNLPIGTIHSLFLTGTTSAPDTMTTVDAPPYHPASDSSMGIRFVNLSPGSAPVSVDIQGEANGSEAPGLPYKSITAFKDYPVTSAVSAYTFEFRDAASGTLLASYTISSTPYFNYTIALEGLPGVGPGPTAQAAYVINNF
jgi:hypothetical protein